MAYGILIHKLMPIVEDEEVSTSEHKILEELAFDIRNQRILDDPSLYQKVRKNGVTEEDFVLAAKDLVQVFTFYGSEAFNLVQGAASLDDHTTTKTGWVMIARLASESILEEYSPERYWMRERMEDFSKETDCEKSMLRRIQALLRPPIQVFA